MAIDTTAILFTPLLELWVLVAHLVMPAREIDGYVRDEKDKPLKYRLNGIPVLITTTFLWAALCHFDILPWTYLHNHTLTHTLTACVIGLLISAYLVATAAPPNPSHTVAQDFFLGRILNPRTTVLGRTLDIKMYLYLIGAVHLELNLLSYAAAHYQAAGKSVSEDPGVAVAVGFLSWFVVEYLHWENVHLYTYDLFAERVGFKLAWGCLCFYPFFYPIGVLAAVGSSPSSPRSWVYYAFAAVVFFSGWGLSRGANLQKYWFKIGAYQNAGDMVVTNGKKTLFCGGLWGRARHINYVGETLEAVGIALAVTGEGWRGAVPWLYPVYYLALFVTRERDDDARCREKYGALWEEYCRRVPWRMVPGVY